MEISIQSYKNKWENLQELLEKFYRATAILRSVIDRGCAGLGIGYQWKIVGKTGFGIHV